MTQVNNSSIESNTPSKVGGIPLELLVEKYVRLILLSKKEEFKSDDEYLELLEARYHLFFLLADSKVILTTNILTSVDSLNKSALESQQNIYNGLSSLLKNIENLCKLRMEKSNKNKGYIPRIERLSNVLEFNEKEKIAFQYIVLHNIGIHFPSAHKTFDGRGMLRNMALISSMSSREVLNFLSPSRKHMKDGLFESTDGVLSYEFSSVTFKMTKETLTALMGANLTSEQFLMVDSTSLGEILIKEGVSPSNLPSSGEKKNDRKKSNVSQSSENDILLKDENDSDVYALLKTLANEDKIDIIEEKDKEEKRDNTNSNEILPYVDDLDYLQDHFKVIESRIAIFLGSLEDKDSYKFNQKTQKTTLREHKSKEKTAYKKCVARLNATSSLNKFVPRMEKLINIRNLDEFEKWVILTLIGLILSIDIIKAAQQGHIGGRYNNSLTVGEMLAIHCTELRSQIQYRKYFYKTAKLIKENIIKIHEPRLTHNSDLMNCHIEIDRRMVDYCVSLDMEFNSLVEGSALYSPVTKLDDVILSSKIKSMILNTISGMEEFRRVIKNLGYNNSSLTSNYHGNGIVILFHGISGTGKTMMAHAIANYLKRKLLLINFPSLQTGDKTEELLKLSFREAKIQNAIIFFDECESLFESRDKRGQNKVNIVLNVIEQYDDLIILATNRPFDLDEAMYRRIQLAVEFPPPDVHLREQIWKNHLPNKIKLDKNVNLSKLSLEFELTGGFIRNACISAIKSSMLRYKNSKNNKNNNLSLDNIVITHDDLLNACKQQIIGQLQLTGFSRRVVPELSLNDIVLEKKVLKQVERIINKHKANKVLSGQWGLKFNYGICILICGPNGVGKTTLSEVIAYECGKPMKLLTMSELLNIHRTTHLKNSNHTNNNRESILSDLNTGACVVIEDAHILFRQNIINDVIGYILFEIRRYKTMFIFIHNGKLSSGDVISFSSIQKTLFNHFDFIIKLDNPNKELRHKLWKKMLPKNTPVSKNNKNEIIDFKLLSEKYNKFVHKDIKRIIIESCGIACLRDNISQRYLKMSDLINCCNRLEKQKEEDGLFTKQLNMYC